MSLCLQAVNEVVSLKQSIFEDIEKVCSPDCIFASNTSTISLDVIGERTSSQDRILGIHLFRWGSILYQIFCQNFYTGLWREWTLLCMLIRFITNNIYFIRAYQREDRKIDFRGMLCRILKKGLISVRIWKFLSRTYMFHEHINLKPENYLQLDQNVSCLTFC